MPNTPSFRNTRSGSNSSAVNLNDIKVLIENSKSEILNAVKHEVEKINDAFGPLLIRVEELEKRNERLESEIQQMRGRSERLATTGHEEWSDTREDLLNEMEERHRRRKYLIVSGLPESRTGSIEDRRLKDRELIGAIASVTGMDEFEPRDIHRIGRLDGQRPRLLRLKCKDLDTKLAFLRAAKSLRNSSDFRKVYINPDLTRVQREKGKALRAELKARREAGEMVTIRRGKIIDTPAEENFH